MSHKVTLCNSEGQRLCGSSGHIQSDGRFNLASVKRDIAEYRERFRKHFAWKVEYWTHFYFDNQPSKLYSIE